MPQELIPIIVLAAPVLLMVVLRINAALVFLSLCLGAVLVQFVAGEASSLVGMFSEKAGSVSASSMQLGLLFAPALITCVVTIFSVHGKLRALFNILPAAAATAFAFILAVPVLPTGLSNTLKQGVVWTHLDKATALVIGMGALASLVFLWLQRGSTSKRKKKH